MAKKGQNEGSIRKRKDGRWEARVTVGIKPNGSPDRKSIYGSTREQTAAKMTALLNEVNNQTYVEQTDMAVSEWIDTYMEHYKKMSVKPTSYITYQNHVPKIKLFLGSIKLKDLRAGKIQQFIVHLQKNGLAASTIQIVYAILHSALEQAVSNDLIGKNVAYRTRLPTKEKKEFRVLTLEEQETFEKTAKNYRLGKLFIFDLFTGLRIGELLTLKWEDVDFEKKWIHVKRTLNRLKDEKTGKWYHTFGTPKTKSSYRSVPLQEAAIKLLNDIKQSQAEDMLQFGTAYERNDLIFCSQLGKMQEQHNMRTLFKKICSKSGIDGLTIHSLRHTFATRGLENGIDMRVMQEFLGHGTYKETADTYTHVLPNKKESEMKKLEGVVNY